MGTRGVIAKKTETGFEGRYHHWDSYPSGLGQTLYELYNGHFQKDIDAMLKVLIDDHPAGWSTINNKDFSLEPGFIEYPSEERKENKRPLCYCHGDRSEKEWLVTEKDASGSGCEWAYVFDVERKIMLVLSSVISDGSKMIGFFGCGDPNARWDLIAKVDLEEQEPDWEAMKD